MIKFAALCLLLAPILHVGAAAADAADPFAHPPELEPDVRFWIRVYTEVTTDQGLLHDDWNLKLVYEVLRFDPASSPAQRERRVAEAKARYAALLRRFAAGDTSDLTAHERRILHAFGEKATPRDYLDAIDRIRFQLGQADRFHEGLIRAAAWETHIARVLEQHGVPAEIAALPHVESSFNPAAYSKVGAAGLWQFMPSTAKRFMRVDGIVDERLDPYSATEAAANLMLYNYRLLGTWPLAVTAYNHGPGGLRRAQDELGTSDIAVIVKRYQGATFGFASRNFYVAFLAALEVDRNAEKYFGPIARLPDTENTPVELPDYIAVGALAKAFKVDMGALKVLNPALRPPIWSGSRLVPRGYALRLPGAQSEAEIAAAWARVPPSQRYLAQRNDGAHRVRRGETLAGIAAASGVSLPRLLAANGWKPGIRSRAAKSCASRCRPRGRKSPARRRPPRRSRRTRPQAGVPQAAPAAAESEPAAPAPAPAAPPPREPVSARQTESAALLPAGPPTGSSDTTDYGVGAGDTVVVQAAETLGHFADWSHVDSQELRPLNKLHKNAGVTRRSQDQARFVQGQRGRFRRRAPRVSPSSAGGVLRRSPHRRHGDLRRETRRIALDHRAATQRPARLAGGPVQPRREFHDVRPGTTITLPQVEAINRQ